MPIIRLVVVAARQPTRVVLYAYTSRYVATCTAHGTGCTRRFTRTDARTHVANTSTRERDREIRDRAVS